jgi:hypothetical protein
MGDLTVSEAEKERLLAEIGVEPSSVILRPASSASLRPVSSPGARPVSSTTIPAAAPASSARLPAVRTVEMPDEPPPAPPRPRSWIWSERRLVSAVVLLVAGSAWLALTMASGRLSAAGLAALAISAGGWVALRPKKA